MMKVLFIVVLFTIPTGCCVIGIGGYKVPYYGQEKRILLSDGSRLFVSVRTYPDTLAPPWYDSMYSAWIQICGDVPSGGDISNAVSYLPQVDSIQIELLPDSTIHRLRLLVHRDSDIDAFSDWSFEDVPVSQAVDSLQITIWFRKRMDAGQFTTLPPIVTTLHKRWTRYCSEDLPGPP